MKNLVLTLALGLAAAGCATQDRSGIRDPDDFRLMAERTTIDSARPHGDVARCFEARAALLPMSSFTAEEGRTIYRLRGFGFTFEEIHFEETPTGSRVTILMAPNLNAKWRRDFARDRAAPLEACAASNR